MQALRRENRAVVLVGGEADGPALDALGPLASRTAAHLPLPTLAALLSRASLFIGHDSGITHLAAASGAPVLALFGPTDPEIWAPPGEGVQVLRGGKNWVETPVEKVIQTIEHCFDNDPRIV